MDSLTNPDVLWALAGVIAALAGTVRVQAKRIKSLQETVANQAKRIDELTAEVHELRGQLAKFMGDEG